MVSGCATPNLDMLRWIAYIKSLNPEIQHISSTDNAMADMLSRARFEDDDGMVSENEEVGADFFKSARMTLKRQSTPPRSEFDEDDYDGEWPLTGRSLKTMTTDTSMTREEVGKLRKKAYRYFLRNGKIWRVPKRRNDALLRVIARAEDQQKLISEFHNSPWSGHRGTWDTFKRLKQKSWWSDIYKSVHDFVSTCESCQMHSIVRHRDELHPTYPPAVHFKWMVDLVTMPMGEGQKRYLVLARQDLTNHVAVRALTNKTTAAVCKFLIEDVICRYRCMGKIMVDRGELDAKEAEELFDQLGVNYPSRGRTTQRQKERLKGATVRS